MNEDYEKILSDSADSADGSGSAKPFSHDEMVVCDKCLRANPPTRPACFYCGAELTLPASTSRAPRLRQPEKWEEGYNVVLLERASVSEELLSGVAELLRLGREEAVRILKAEEPLPLARLDSPEEARLAVDRLQAMGVSAIVISDQDLLMKDEHRRRARAFRLGEDEDALVALAAGSSEVWRAGWSDILLLVTGRLVRRRVETEERRKGSASEVVESREMMGDVLLLDLYTRRTDGGWRVASDSFDFSCLGRRKGLIAAQNFSTLIEVLKERAPQMVVDDSYHRLRHALAPVWPPEERTESQGLRRERPGRMNVQAVMTSDNEMQFTRYSRLRHLLKLREVEGKES